MSLDAALNEFVRECQPTVIGIPAGTIFFRGLSLPADCHPRITNAESAWFCAVREKAVGYARYAVTPAARPILLLARTAAANVFQINLKDMTDKFQAYCPQRRWPPEWQKNDLLPTLMRIASVHLSGIFDAPTGEYWLMPRTYEMGGTEAL